MVLLQMQQGRSLQGTGALTQDITEPSVPPTAPLPGPGSLVLPAGASSPIPPGQAVWAVEREVCSEARQAHAEPGTGRVWGKAGWVGTGSRPSISGDVLSLTFLKNSEDSVPNAHFCPGAEAPP